jgi:hypothetical protein
MRIRFLRSLLGVAGALAILLVGTPGAHTSGQEDPVADDRVRQMPEQRQAEIRALLEQGTDYVPGRVLGKFRDGVSSSVQASAVRRVGAAAGPRYQHDTDFAVVDLPLTIDVVAAAHALDEHPDVEYAQPDHVRQTQQMTPNDPSFFRQWNLQMLDMPRAWEINNGARDVIVAVIDSGIAFGSAVHQFPRSDGRFWWTIDVPFGAAPDLAFEGGQLMGGDVVCAHAGTLLDRPWRSSFLTCAASYAPAIGQPESGDLLQSRIARVLAIARSFGHAALVLGAWGCGAFGNDPHRTASDFRQALEGKFSGAFDEVVFAIADWSPERRHLGPFRDVFGGDSQGASRRSEARGGATPPTRS